MTVLDPTIPVVKPDDLATYFQSKAVLEADLLRMTAGAWPKAEQLMEHDITLTQLEDCYARHRAELRQQESAPLLAFVKRLEKAIISYTELETANAHVTLGCPGEINGDTVAELAMRRYRAPELLRQGVKAQHVITWRAFLAEMREGLEEHALYFFILLLKLTATIREMLRWEGQEQTLQAAAI